MPRAGWQFFGSGGAREKVWGGGGIDSEGGGTGMAKGGGGIASEGGGTGMAKGGGVRPSERGGGDISMGRRGEEHSHCEGIEGVRGVGGHPSSLYAPFASISPISITETHPWHKSTLFHDLQTGIALQHSKLSFNFLFLAVSSSHRHLHNRWSRPEL